MKPELDEIINMVKDCMESAYELLVPLEVDYGTGTNWLEAH